MEASLPTYDHPCTRAGFARRIFRLSGVFLLLLLPSISVALGLPEEPLVQIRQILRMDGPRAEVAQSAIEGRAPTTEAGREGIARIKSWLRSGKTLDRERVLEQLREAARQDDSEAMVWLGLLTAWNAQSEAPLQEAAQWYRRAWSLGNPAGAYYLAALYANGEGMDPDEKESERLVEAAADAGYIPARIERTQLLMRSGDRKGLEELKALAEAGHPEAMMTLAAMYLTGAQKGIWVNQSLPRYHEWLERAYRAGYGRAGWWLSGIYATGGYGRKKDEAKAWAYAQWAGRHGNPAALLTESNGYWLGKYGLEKDWEKSVQKAEAAMQEGSLEAAGALYRRLILMYHKPWTEQQRARILRAIRYAANHGEPNAAFILGSQYWLGDGDFRLGKDMDASIKWLHRSMLLGDARAMPFYYWVLIKGKYRGEESRVPEKVYADCRLWTSAALPVMRVQGWHKRFPKRYQLALTVRDICGKSLRPEVRKDMDAAAVSLAEEYKLKPWVFRDVVQWRKKKALEVREDR